MDDMAGLDDPIFKTPVADGVKDSGLRDAGG
jgi:hypothetical protein